MEITEQPQDIIIRQIESIISKEKVIREAKAFLITCDWMLEIDEEMVSIPQDIEIHIRSRAFIKADTENAVFLDNHYEAVILIGIEDERDKCPKYGYLKMYFNLKGDFISEDRYGKHLS
jgi:hypothetical protein